MVEDKNGTLEGKRLPVYTYSGKRIIEMGKYNEGHETAIEKAKKSKSERTWVKRRLKQLEKHEYMPTIRFLLFLKLAKAEKMH